MWAIWCSMLAAGAGCGWRRWRWLLAPGWPCRVHPPQALPSPHLLICPSFDLRLQRENHIGLIDTKCSPAGVCQDAIDDARSICLREKGDAPEVSVYGDPSFTFPYVPSHLHHMVRAPPALLPPRGGQGRAYLAGAARAARLLLCHNSQQHPALCMGSTSAGWVPRDAHPHPCSSPASPFIPSRCLS